LASYFFKFTVLKFTEEVLVLVVVGGSAVLLSVGWASSGRSLNNLALLLLLPPLPPLPNKRLHRLQRNELFRTSAALQ